MTKRGCMFFWGSHGCDLPDDEHHVHRCELGTDDSGMCCEYDEDRPADARVNWWEDDGTRSGWRPYVDGWWMTA